ncbi:MAG TPA: antitoxin VapB family protein [Candidatus Nanoarchaeia archaeon]|nr:antitoxin VapB family protein [Candidatus Nanoarchaeia archaeon]
MVKIISLSDDAYLLLKREKRPGESFSMVVRRTHGGKKDSLLKHAGWWHGSDEECDRIFKEIFERRHDVDRRFR